MNRRQLFTALAALPFVGALVRRGTRTPWLDAIAEETRQLAHTWDSPDALREHKIVWRYIVNDRPAERVETLDGYLLRINQEE